MLTYDVENTNGEIREDIYDFLTSCGLFFEEQKGCCKWTRATGQLLYIFQHILSESKTRRKNLAMARIDYKKAYDIIVQRWIINCQKIYKISHEVINFIEKIMKTRIVELRAGGKSFAETDIQRGIFQVDALTLLLFIIVMMPLNHTHRKCTAEYKLSKSKENQSHNIHWRHQTLCRKWKRTGICNTRSQNIQSGNWDIIWPKKKIYYSSKKIAKRHLTDRIRTLRENET